MHNVLHVLQGELERTVATRTVVLDELRVEHLPLGGVTHVICVLALNKQPRIKDLRKMVIWALIRS